MHSERPDYGGQRWHYGDRDARHRDDYNDRWQDHQTMPRYSSHTHGGTTYSGAERSSRSTNYSDSPPRLYTKESLDRERDRDMARKSPKRRPQSSPDWSERKRERFTDDSHTDNRYRPEPVGKKYRQSPVSFSHMHEPKDLKPRSPQEDIKYRKATQESRNWHRAEELTSRHQHPGDSTRRQDRHGHGRDRSHSPETKPRPQDDSSKRYAKSGGRQDGCLQTQARKLLDGSMKQSFERETKPCDDTSKEEKLTNGFQRFLDVLNKGVDVDMLSKIVTQDPAGGPAQPQSPASFQNVVEHPRFPDREQRAQLNVKSWREDFVRKKCYLPPFPQPRVRSCSPKRNSLSHDVLVQRHDGGQDCYNSRSPPVSERKALTHVEHKQMQDVLQAIGMDLGFEELGQMSHRIQERLYGKKDSDWSYQRQGSRQRVTKPAYSPRRHSRSSSSSSSSSRSSFNSSWRNHSLHRDSYSAQSDPKVDGTQVPVSICDEPRSSSRSSPDDHKYEIQERNSPNITASMPTRPAYPPVNYPAMLYPHLPPSIPNMVPGLLLPPRASLPLRPPLPPFTCRPPFQPYPCPPPYPFPLAPTRHLLPPHVNNNQPLHVNLPHFEFLPVNTPPKTKPASRPRCLQVIETKKS
ncbi:zinc finger protein 318-like isoform X2 [Dunckerocampus dactyliophorus]|uniref:zinc finger protein 318-like isoform X2 n=1 Tax=Dunckerocampus dactyliophorus TaxID=161453 RepID=UPI0024050D4C|nr:zinc finger protein 318-like isoform X2 [Dunckerocampus dactyliophorus]XP_054635420.1 zinc finger protein 318-like isoform X2 [Dunckerocampus dactyliophorus]